MKAARQLEILQERHGIRDTDFESYTNKGILEVRLYVGVYVLQATDSGVVVSAPHCKKKKIHNWVAAVTYAKAREAARRAKESRT